jgi:hypothetical protein
MATPEGTNGPSSSADEAVKNLFRADPMINFSREIAEKYQSGLSDEDIVTFVNYLRGKLEPETLDETQRTYFERVNAHVHVDGFLDMATHLHELVDGKPRHDNRTAYLAERVRDILSPQLRETLAGARNLPHGFQYERDADSKEMAIVDGVCLGALLALVDFRQQTIEALYGGPSNLRISDSPSTTENPEGTN